MRQCFSLLGFLKASISVPLQLIALSIYQNQEKSTFCLIKLEGKLGSGGKFDEKYMEWAERSESKGYM